MATATGETFPQTLGDEHISAAQAARLLGVTKQRMSQLIQAGSVPSTRVGRSVLVPVEAVQARKRLRDECSSEREFEVLQQIRRYQSELADLRRDRAEGVGDGC